MKKLFQLLYIATIMIIGCGRTSEENRTDTSEAKVAAEAGITGNVGAGKALFATCAACHGQNAGGTATLNAPALANQQPWYLKQQLNNFRNGRRGVHEKDVFGAQMLPMAGTLADDEAIGNVIAYIKSLPQVKTEKTLVGSAEEGANYYSMICGSCHGPKAVGNAMLRSPSLVGTDDWYLKRQLDNFRAGIRGTHGHDLLGIQMSEIAKTIPDDKAIVDVVAYIQSLQEE